MNGPRIEVSSYLIRTLAALRPDFDGEAVFVVEELARGVHRVENSDGLDVVVNSNVRLVDDYSNDMLPDDYPGRVTPELTFSVSWERPDGEMTYDFVKASSPQLARLHIGAPDNALVEVYREDDDYGAPAAD